MTTRFDGVDLTPNMKRMLRNFKRQMIESLEVMVEEGDLNLEMTLKEAIQSIKLEVEEPDDTHDCPELRGGHCQMHHDPACPCNAD